MCWQAATFRPQATDGWIISPNVGVSSFFYHNYGAKPLVSFLKAFSMLIRIVRRKIKPWLGVGARIRATTVQTMPLNGGLRKEE